MINGMTNRKAALHHCTDGVCAELRAIDDETSSMCGDGLLPYRFFAAYCVGNWKREKRLWDLAGQKRPQRSAVLAEVRHLQNHIHEAYEAVARCYTPGFDRHNNAGGADETAQ